MGTLPAEAAELLRVAGRLSGDVSRETLPGVSGSGSPRQPRVARIGHSTRTGPGASALAGGDERRGSCLFSVERGVLSPETVRGCRRTAWGTQTADDQQPGRSRPRQVSRRTRAGTRTTHHAALTGFAPWRNRCRFHTRLLRLAPHLARTCARSLEKRNGHPQVPVGSHMVAATVERALPRYLGRMTTWRKGSSPSL